MVNSIRSIEPKWGEKNIPPRPGRDLEFKQTQSGTMAEIVTNQDELDEWEKLFGDKVREIDTDL